MPGFSKSAPRFTKSVPLFTKSVPGFSKSVPLFTKSVPGFTKSVPLFTKSVPGFTKSVPLFTKSVPLFTKSVPGFSKSVPLFTKSVPGFSNSNNHLCVFHAPGAYDLLHARIRVDLCPRHVLLFGFHIIIVIALSCSSIRFSATASLYGESDGRFTVGSRHYRQCSGRRSVVVGNRREARGGDKGRHEYAHAVGHRRRVREKHTGGYLLNRFSKSRHGFSK